MSNKNKEMEKQSVAQQLINNLTKSIPAILFETYSKVPDEKDIEWAKQRVASLPTPLNEGSESMEALANEYYINSGFALEPLSPLVCRKIYAKGYAASQQATFTEIEKEIKAQFAHGSLDSATTLTNLLTKLKTTNI